MKKTLSCVLVLAVYLFLTAIPASAQGQETAITRSTVVGERVAIYDEPSVTARLKGEYFDGVQVTVLEYISNEWAKIDIPTYGESGHGFVRVKDIVSGSEAAGLVKTTLPCRATGSFMLNTAPVGQSGDIGPFEAGTQVEVLGLTVPGEATNITRPLVFKTSGKHVRIGDITGFLIADGDDVLIQTGAYYAGYPIAIVNNPNPADRLNLRKSANQNAETLGKYYNGTVVVLLSDAQSGWVNVKIGNLEGYMNSEFLAFGTPVESIASAKPIVAVSNSTGKFNLREKQSQQSTSLGLFPNGTKVEVLGLTETWCHVLADGQIGFMLTTGLSPKPQFNSTQAGGASQGSGGSAGGTQNGSTGNGATGSLYTGEWTIPILEYVGIVNNPNASDRLHLRAEPSENARSLGKYYNGTQVIINGDIDGEWTYVGVGDSTPSNPTGYCIMGYMKTKFLSISSPTPPASAMPILTVNNPNSARNLHLRQKQSTSSKSLGLYPNGTKAVVAGFTDEWAHVIVDGKLGFMQHDKLSPNLMGQGGVGNQRASLRVGSSTQFTTAEIQAAAKPVIAKFIDDYESRGCTLIDFWYDEAASNDFIQNNFDAQGKENHAIVLFTTFMVDSARSMEDGFEPGRTYKGWMFVLTRENAAGAWHLETWGMV